MTFFIVGGMFVVLLVGAGAWFEAKAYSTQQAGVSLLSAVASAVSLLGPGILLVVSGSLLFVARGDIRQANQAVHCHAATTTAATALLAGSLALLVLAVVSALTFGRRWWLLPLAIYLLPALPWTMITLEAIPSCR